VQKGAGTLHYVFEREVSRCRGLEVLFLLTILEN
jgi:hypothetical protein